MQTVPRNNPLQLTPVVETDSSQSELGTTTDPTPAPPRNRAGIWVVGSRFADFRRRVNAHHYLSLPAGPRGRHQHAAAPGRSRPPLHQQIRLSHLGHRTRRRGGLPLSARPGKSYIKRVIALPGDRLRIDHGQVWLNGSRSDEAMFRRSIATPNPWRRWSFPKAPTS
jgi:hypothetical protein